jgi:hypothetical protein
VPVVFCVCVCVSLVCGGSALLSVFLRWSVDFLHTARAFVRVSWPPSRGLLISLSLQWKRQSS